MTKKIAFLYSLIGVIVFFVAMYPVNIGICEKPDYSCRDISDLIQMLFGIFPFVLLFSLITYKMKEEVFRAWWNFARWFVPIIMMATYFLENAGGSGGYINAKQDATVLILFILYAILIITSLAKIFRTYRKTRA